MARAVVICAPDPLAAGVIRGWLEGGHEIAEIWTSDGHRVGQGERTLTRWAPNWSVRALAGRNSIPVFVNPPLKSWSGAAEHVAALRADTLVSAVTMQIVPQHIIDIFGSRAVNFHPAMLPFFRGPTPYEAMLLDGCENTHSGMTLHQMVRGIDEGPIIAQRLLPYASAGGTYRRWKARLAQTAREIAREELPSYLAGEVVPQPQHSGSYRNVRAAMMIGPHVSLADVERLLMRVGHSHRCRAGLPGRSMAVVGIDRVLGRPNGRPPKLTPLSVTLDIADARVRLKRLNDWQRGLDRLETVRELRRIDAQE